MKQRDDLGRHLRHFLADYLPRQRNASPRTIEAYRDALKLLLQFASRLRGNSVADLSFEDLHRETVLAFLESIESERHNAVTTRNHRLAVIRSFFRFVSSTSPEAIDQGKQILAIPWKRAASRSIDYLTLDEVAALLAEISTRSPEGRRDDALLRFLYNTGARVQEALGVLVSDLRLETSPFVVLRGKGRKERLCPLWPDTVERLRSVLADHGSRLDETFPVFAHPDGKPLTRFGVRYILAKYVRQASERHPGLARKRIHPHTIRHTTAMHLLQSGVDLNTIRCWMGHASVVTTNRYVEIDLEMKRRALGELTPVRGPSASAPGPDPGLIAWLESL